MVLNDTRRHVEARRAPQLLLLFERPFSRRGHALAAHASSYIGLAIMVRRTTASSVALDRVFQGRDVVDPVRRDVEDLALPQYGIDGARAFGRKGLLRLLMMRPVNLGMAKRRVFPISDQIQMSTRRRRRQYVALRTSQHRDLCAPSRHERLEIEKETTHFIVRWRRVAPMA